MKLFRSLPLAVLATVISSLTPFNSAKAITFNETDVEQSQFIAVASPLGEDRYDLLVIEQIPGKQACWRETGSQPTAVEPLLLNFDFTGICNRSTDSNGYSVRVEGQDLGMDYLLRVVERNGELLLVGTPRDRQRPEIVIGKSAGIAENGFTKLVLNPGWQFTKRTYDGKTLGHVYFSGTQTAQGVPENLFPAGSTAFGDITNDLYKTEIEQAVALGFISGFQDSTFRPEEPLTREQLVSMVIEALSNIQGANTSVPANVATAPYPDVDASRWSTAKIEWAKQNQIVTGYPDGTFQPAREVTRAELMAVLRRAAEYAKAQQGKTPELTAQETAKNFSDLTGHWSENLVTQMSAYCGVASPLNETGNSFNPDTSALRNYAAAATLRTLNCLQAQATPTVTQPNPSMDGSTPTEGTTPNTVVPAEENNSTTDETTPNTVVPAEENNSTTDELAPTEETNPRMEQSNPGS